MEKEYDVRWQLLSDQNIAELFKAYASLKFLEEMHAVSGVYKICFIKLQNVLN